MSDEVERLWEHAERDPMPSGLEDSLRDLIEPFTMKEEVEHAAVMDALKIAYPVIKDWLFTQTVNWNPQIRSHEG
jgi:hypothetical protein